MAAERAGSAAAAAAAPNGKLFRHLCDRLGKSSKEGAKSGLRATGAPHSAQVPREPSIIDGELQWL